MAKDYRLGFWRKAANVIATAGLRVGVAPRASSLLTTIGRKTGRRHTTPVWAFEHDGERFLVSPYGEVGWVRNVRATGEATLTRARKSTTHSVTELTTAEAAPILKRYMNKVAVTRPFFDATKDAPVAEFEAEATRHPVFRLGPPR
jgi:deazaflavin-dependent oxidoreductase (nitroreductase family)